MVYAIGSLLLSIFSPVQSALVVAVARMSQKLPEITSNEINFYAIGVFAVAFLVLILGNITLSVTKKFGPDGFEYPQKIFYTRLIWNLFGLLQVRIQNPVLSHIY